MTEQPAGGGPFRARPQSELEEELARIIEFYEAAESEERASWWGGQVIALLYALGVERLAAIETAYQIWSERPP